MFDDCSILDMVRRNNYRILNLLLKLPTGFKQRDLDVALVHAVKAGFFDCAKVLLFDCCYCRQGRIQEGWDGCPLSSHGRSHNFCLEGPKYKPYHPLFISAA